MIINKETKSILSRSDKPNENWTSQDCYVVDDNSELGKKIFQNYPNIDYVIENGEIKDVNILPCPEPLPNDNVTTEQIIDVLLGVSKDE